MPGDATTIPFGRAAGDAPSAGASHWPWRRRATTRSHADAGVLAGALSLVAILAISVFVVLVAANRPSVIAPTTHTGFFPGWMAGPLGGMLPGFTNSGTTLKYLFTGAIVAMYVSYLLVLKYVPRLPARWVIATILAAHAIYLLSPPLALTDLFNYINYGRMEVVHNLNPYTTIPILEPHNDPSFLLSNWHELLSPYGPLFTLVTFAVVPLGVGGSFWALKALLVLTSLATILLVWKSALLLNRDPRAAVALVGLNPIVLVWGLGGDHNDFLMLFFVMLAFYLLLLARARAQDPSKATHGADGTEASSATAPRTRPAAQIGGVGANPGAGSGAAGSLRGWLWPLSLLDVAAGGSFVIAIGLKASAAVLVPVVLASLLRARRALVQVVLGMLAAAVVVAAVSLLAFGLHIPDLSTQSELVTSESIPNLIGLLFGAGGENALVRAITSLALVVSVAWCSWFGWRRRDTVTASGWASVALLVTLSWVLPWYVLWILPLAALSRSRRLRTVALVLGAYLIVTWAPASAVLWDALDFHPEKTPLGRLHQRYVKELLN
jgi:alpha-1,6-mannosyltransferase